MSLSISGPLREWCRRITLFFDSAAGAFRSENRGLRPGTIALVIALLRRIGGHALGGALDHRPPGHDDRRGPKSEANGLPLRLVECGPSTTVGQGTYASVHPACLRLR
jgi:hypothetical protein